MLSRRILGLTLMLGASQQLRAQSSANSRAASGEPIYLDIGAGSSNSGSAAGLAGLWFGSRFVVGLRGTSAHAGESVESPAIGDVALVTGPVVGNDRVSAMFGVGLDAIFAARSRAPVAATTSTETGLALHAAATVRISEHVGVEVSYADAQGREHRFGVAAVGLRVGRLRWPC